MLSILQINWKKVRTEKQQEEQKKLFAVSHKMLENSTYAHSLLKGMAGYILMTTTKPQPIFIAKQIIDKYGLPNTKDVEAFSNMITYLNHKLGKEATMIVLADMLAMYMPKTVKQILISTTKASDKTSCSA